MKLAYVSALALMGGCATMYHPVQEGEVRITKYEKCVLEDKGDKKEFSCPTFSIYMSTPDARLFLSDIIEKVHVSGEAQISKEDLEKHCKGISCSVLRSVLRFLPDKPITIKYDTGAKK